MRGFNFTFKNEAIWTVIFSVVPALLFLLVVFFRYLLR